MGLANIMNPDSMYLVSIDTYGNETKYKVWGTINNILSYQMTYQKIDDSQRALCTLTRNTYQDTLLKTTERFAANVAHPEYPISTTDKLSLVVDTYETQEQGTIKKNLLTKTIWSNSLNPEITNQTIVNVIGAISQYKTPAEINATISETQLLSLVDFTQIPSATSTTPMITSTTGESTVSVNEQLALEE